MHAAERLLAGHVIHQDEAHGSPVVGGGDGAIALLPRSVLRSLELIGISKIDNCLFNIYHSFFPRKIVIMRLWIVVNRLRLLMPISW